MTIQAADNAAEIVNALINDSSFSFKQIGKYLQQGVCPGCGKKEAYVSLDKPWRVACNRSNNCGYAESTREIYPDLFDNYAERYPSTPEDPHATARAYLIENRGFNSGLIGGWYEQGAVRTKAGDFADTVRFYLFGGHDTYWERIVDTQMAKKAGKKANFGGKRQPDGSLYKNQCWQPPRQTIDQGDWIWITEGIFKAIALIHCKRDGKQVKAVSPLSTNNLPRDLISANRDKGITWVLAFDNDKAGIEANRKYKAEIEKLGQRVVVAITVGDADWDDELRNKRLNEDYLNLSLWRGQLAVAASAQDKAFWLWVRNPRSVMRFSHDNALHRFKFDEKKGEELSMCWTEINGCWTQPETDLSYHRNQFAAAVKGEQICNCVPQFLYIEQDEIQGEQDYVFQIDYANGNPRTLLPMDGTYLESPSSFNKALLRWSLAGRFKGNSSDLDYLADRWFNQGTKRIDKIDFIGYDRDRDIYVFPEFGYKNGRRFEVNSHGYIDTGKVQVKTGLKGIRLTSDGKFDPAMITAFYKVFALNGLAAMAWWLGSLFAEQMRAHYENWPFIELTGEPGAGKTTLIEFLWRCCGRANWEGQDPNKTTQAGRAAMFRQVGGLPIFLTEGDRGSDDRGARRGSFDYNELKDYFGTSVVRTMGTKSMGADTYAPPFRGAIGIAQNASVQAEEAVMERIVHCHFGKSHFTRESQMLARKLATTEVEDLAGWMARALSQEKPLLESFDKHYDRIEKAFQEQGLHLRNRIVQCHAKVAAWGWGLQLVFGKQYLPDGVCQQLESYLFEMANGREDRLKSDNPVVEKFWEIYDLIHIRTANDNDQYGAADQEQINHSSKEGQIAIHLIHFNQVCANRRVEQIPIDDLKKLLPDSRRHKFKGQKTVTSAIDGKSKWCWVFEAVESL
ncbi:MAG: toprim domain-containing protein [Motiliproteus sp.]